MVMQPLAQHAFDDPRFELRGRLGSGGMGTVHRAFDRLHGREVALKVGRPVLGESGGEPDAARIGEEFALLTNLDHAGLVRVLDFGLTARPDNPGSAILAKARSPGSAILARTAWLTSEIVSGPRLDVWAGRAATADGLVAMAVELLETLGWLHARGLVHGDVKPANILVGAGGPVLIDFGLAGSGETLFGATRAYAAPELLHGGAPSAASDLFALGRTLARVAPVASRSDTLTTLIDALCAEVPGERATVAQALAMLGVRDGQGVGQARAQAATKLPWSGAIERALRYLEDAHLDLRIAPEHRHGFLGALAARLMLAGRPAWVLPEGAGLGPFARVAAALGSDLVAPAGTLAEDQREVLDAFTDRLIGAVRALPNSVLPVLLVGDSEGLGAAGRFVLARLIEARALPGFAIVSGEQPLERGVASALVRLEVLASEATGRRWEAEWAGLADGADTVDGRTGAQAVARELWGLGGAARVDELATRGARRALSALQEAAWTQRAAEGRTALQADVLAALGSVIALDAVTADERRRWLQVLAAAARAGTASEAMQRALARHALVLGESETALAAFRAAASAAETSFAWARAGADRTEAARLLLGGGNAQAAFEEAQAGLKALAAGGGGPLGGAALAVAMAAVAAVKGPDGEALRLRAAVLRARAALQRGAVHEAIAAADEVIDGAPKGEQIPWKVRFEALLVRGTARSEGDDKASAEADLSRAARLAEDAQDLNALGRVANNLGMLAFHRGDLNAAADAWARAADAKARTGDLRGERIGRHNRGLALRELGRLDEATAAASEAAALSDRIGDEVGRATAALARAQLALDVGQVAAAEEALATFASVAWKPAMVAADGRLVRVRLELAKGLTADAEQGAREALEGAVTARLEPVAAEAWALLQVITGQPSAPPPLVAGAVARAGDERGGLALLLLFARVFGDAHAGRWGTARAGLERVVERLAEGPLPPAARVGVALAVDAARLVEPKWVAVLETARVGERVEVKGAARKVAGSGAGMAVESRVGRASLVATEGKRSVLADLASWARRLCEELGAGRVEIVAVDPDYSDVVVAASEGAVGTARFVDLGRRVARGSEPFIGRAGDGRAEVIAVPLVVAASVVGALVAEFGRDAGRPEMLLAEDSGATLEVVALALGYAIERWRRERAEAEVVRLCGALEEHQREHEAEVTALRDALEQSQSVLSLRYDYAHIVHRSAAMRKILETLDKVTDRELPVLILGESGVGKELLARALHFNGPRGKKRFMAENCGAIPKDLFESQFFGHAKGAFTGALSARQGLFEAAQGGTLFLDEIGELPLEMQVKLLRVLQDRVVRPVGTNREIPVDFRLVCATNRDLTQMVAEGRFREDLFYRIAVVKLEVPALRKRAEDIVPIAEQLLAQHAQRLGRVVRLTPEAADRLATYPFPGNVRELDNELLRALALSDGPEIKPRHLSAALQGRSEPRRKSTDSGGDGALETLEAAFARVEKELLIKHLRASRGQKVAAAKSLGLSRPGLDAKLARHAVDAKELARTLKETSG